MADDRSFKPLYLLSYLLSEWKEPQNTPRRISPAVVLPSGIEPRQFSVRVVNGGECLEVSVHWPQPLVCLETLHKKWLISEGEYRFKIYHPKVFGFETALHKLRNQTSDIVESVARTLLPFPVQPQIEQKYNLGWKESTARMVYIEHY